MTIIAWLFLFTFGLSGVLPSLTFGWGYYRPLLSFFFFLVYTVCGMIALLASLLLLKKVPVFQSLGNKKWESHYNRIPIDVCLIIFALIGGYTVFQVAEMGFPHSYLDVFQYAKYLVFSTVLVTLTIIQAQFIIGRLQNQNDLKNEWEKSILNKVVKGISVAFLNRSIGIQMMLLLVIVFASGFGVMVVLLYPPAIILYVPLFLVVTVPALVVFIRRVGYFNRIFRNITGLIQGNAEPDIPVKGHSIMAELAQNVNTLKHGVETSQAEQAKSERFETELITNVSHDLRTPLTSVITYTELLKTPELPDDERDTYIEIIDRKSKRLKVLIDDLFEASKMASGSIELVKEKVDMNQLLQQALAENDEMISESTLQFRVMKPDTPVYCIVDGQKLWRVFDNLIGNILKYSLDHTRVYISVKMIRDHVVMTFKNITKYELSENIDELFERFKRGDKSRHTDGSGLGLAIAKSIVDLHEGKLDIEVDGDLFKVTVSLKSVAD
jgi:signal transduction histidine kinase